MSVTSSDHIQPDHLARRLPQVLAVLPAWAWVAAGIFVLVTIQSNLVLFDTDTYWQIKVGQWIVDNRAMPHVDIYSFTKAGEPWISSSWLSQVLFAGAYDHAGWGGVLMLTALAAAAAFALLVVILSQRLSGGYACFVAAVAFSIMMPHILARPHMLALPVTVAWFGGLIFASDRRAAPSFWLLPLMVLWTNLHGSFVLGLALVPAVALDALWNADAAQRKTLAVHWILFGLGTLAACCLTPYGWNSLLAAQRILGLGEALSCLQEWAPVNFGRPDLFATCLLLSLAAALYCGVTLTPPRILLTLGFVYMALSHVRNIDQLVLLLPIALLTPLADRFGWTASSPPTGASSRRSATLTVMILAIGLVATGAFVSAKKVRPGYDALYAEALAVLKDHKSERVLNGHIFGGPMIWAGMRPFADGRSELYGERFLMDYFNATSLSDPNMLFRLLDTYRIDATLQHPTAASVKLLDHLDGWTRVYSSELAVVHVRTRPAGDAPPKINTN